MLNASYATEHSVHLMAAHSSCLGLGGEKAMRSLQRVAEADLLGMRMTHDGQMHQSAEKILVPPPDQTPDANQGDFAISFVGDMAYQY